MQVILKIIKKSTGPQTVLVPKDVWLKTNRAVQTQNMKKNQGLGT